MKMGRLKMVNELQTINERIAERVGEQLVDLIPEDQWKTMVDREINKFKLETAPKLIRELIKEKYTDSLKKAVDELLLQDEWNDLTQNFTNESLKKLLSASGGEIFAGVMQPAMQQVMRDLRNNLGY